MRVSAKSLTVLVFVLALGIRAFHLNIPFLEPFNNYSRQSMCASVARNFYERGFNLLYPEIDENGSGASLYNVEMPLYSYFMAIGYKLARGVKEWVARSVSVFFSMGMLLFLFLFIRRIAGGRVARWSLAFAALSPMSVALSRSIQPDITMLFAITGALYFFYLYRHTDKLPYFMASAVLFQFAVLTRVFALYLFLPLFYLLWQKEGVSLFRKPRNYLYALTVVLALIWYVYMWQMGKTLELAYEPYCYSAATSGVGFFGFLKPSHLALPAKAMLIHLLTPLGCGLFLLGITTKRHKEEVLFDVWLWSTVLYLLLLWRTAVIHPYYFLPLLAPAAFFVGRGAIRIRDASGILNNLNRPVWVTVAAIFLTFNLLYYYRLLYFVPAERMVVVEAGRAVDETVPKNALVLAAYGASPIQLYYVHRRGWALDMEGEESGLLIKELENRRKQGAGYFMTTQLGILAEKTVFFKHLSTYPVFRRTDRYVIYDLKSGEMP